MDDPTSIDGPGRARPRGKLTPRAFQERLDRFADMAGDLVPESTRSFRLQHYHRQLVRSSSSAGASFSEARSAATQREFEFKLHQSVKELRESATWLKHLAHVMKQPLTELLDECDQLIAIHVASIHTLRRRRENGGEGRKSASEMGNANAISQARSAKTRIAIHEKDEANR